MKLNYKNPPIIINRILNLKIIKRSSPNGELLISNPLGFAVSPLSRGNKKPLLIKIKNLISLP
jgi:hypothetical protein